MSISEELQFLLERARTSLPELLVTFRAGGPQAVKLLVAFFWDNQENEKLALIHPGLHKAINLDPVNTAYLLSIYPGDYRKVLSSFEAVATGTVSNDDQLVVFESVKALRPLNFSLNTPVLEWMFSELSFTTLPEVEEEVLWLILAYSNYPILEVADRIIPQVTGSANSCSTVSSAFPEVGYRLGIASSSTARFLQLVESLSDKTFYSLLKDKDLSFLDEGQLRNSVRKHQQFASNYAWGTSETMPFREKLDLICAARIKELLPFAPDPVVTLILELWKKDDTTFVELTHVFEE